MGQARIVVNDSPPFCLQIGEYRAFMWAWTIDCACVCFTYLLPANTLGFCVYLCFMWYHDIIYHSCYIHHDLLWAVSEQAYTCQRDRISPTKSWTCPNLSVLWACVDKPKEDGYLRQISSSRCTKQQQSERFGFKNINTNPNINLCLFLWWRIFRCDVGG